VKEPAEDQQEVELVEEEVDDDEEDQQHYSQAVKIINHNRLSKYTSHNDCN
jgi:hypothetical protein